MEPIDKSTEHAFDIIDQMDISPVTKVLAKSILVLGGNPVPFLVYAISAEKTAIADQLHPKLPMPEDYTETERVLHEMLVENTGAHLLDSGDIYGRHWQENRKVRDFRKLPEVLVEEDYVAINIFHYLNRFLERDRVSKELEAMFYSYADLPENRSVGWLSLMIDYAETVLKENGWTYYAANSYNWENFLSQGIQYVMAENDDGEKYILLQIHNGCDIRGGYTKPRVFKVVEGGDGDFEFEMDTVFAICKCSTSDGIRAIEAGIGVRWLFDDDEQGAEDYEWKDDVKGYVCNHCGEKLSFYMQLD